MIEKERRLYCNLSLAQNIVICLMYAFLLLAFVLMRVSVKGLFDTINIQRQGEIDDVVGWGKLFYVKSTSMVNIAATTFSVGMSLFFLITGIYLLVMLCRKREEIAAETL